MPGWVNAGDLSTCKPSCTLTPPVLALMHLARSTSPSILLSCQAKTEAFVSKPSLLPISQSLIVRCVFIDRYTICLRLCVCYFPTKGIQEVVHSRT